jgi:hypothetical protein
MSIDTNRLIQIANELKTLDQHRQRLLAELQRIAGDVTGVAPVARRRGRPPRASVPAAPPSRAELVVPRRNGGRTKGLTSAVLDFLKSSGGAHTAGEIVVALRRPKTKSGLATVSTTLVRLAREGRVKKDKERGYRAE